MNVKGVLFFLTLEVFCTHFIFTQVELNPSFIVAQSYSLYPANKFGFGVGIEVGYSMQNAKMELGLTSNFIWNIPSKSDFKSFTQHSFALYLKKAIFPKYNLGIEAGGLNNYFRNTPVELNDNEIFGGTRSAWNQYYFNVETGYLMSENLGIQLGCAYALGYRHIKDLQQYIFSVSFTYHILWKQTKQTGLDD